MKESRGDVPRGVRFTGVGSWRGASSGACGVDEMLSSRVWWDITPEGGRGRESEGPGGTGEVEQGQELSYM